MTAENLVKIYNDEGEVIQPTTREEAERKGLIIATVVVALFNTDDEVWLSLRSHNKSTHPGMWDITVAGCVDDADGSNLDAAVREVQEETGLDVDLASAGKLRFTFSENGGTVIRMPEVFYGSTNETPKITDDEVAGFARFPLNTFRRNFEAYPSLYIPNIREEIELAATHLGMEK